MLLIKVKTISINHPIIIIIKSGDFFMIEKLLKTMLSLVLCGGILLGGSYLYLKYDPLEKLSNVQSQKKDVPYSSEKQNTPENCGLLFTLPDESGCLVYLDFEAKKISVLPTGDTSEIGDSFKGYDVNNVISCEYSLISELVDRIGGINMEIDEEQVRLTGEQVIEYVCENSSKKTQKQLILSAAKSIKENGVSRSDLVYIMDNCETQGLSLTKCYYWSEYLPEMSENVSVIL